MHLCVPLVSIQLCAATTIADRLNNAEATNGIWAGLYEAAQSE